jgi:hypothetical protein
MLSLKPEKDFYSEAEAARILGISISRLHLLLDENLFADGAPRPLDMSFRASELVLLSFWNRALSDPKVLRMPRRS